MNNKLNSTDKLFLSKCIDLAEKALNAGDKPFGSLLVDKDRNILATARNKINTVHGLSHPEYELAAWALSNLDEEERYSATMYTSGEHCPMCAGAHGWAGIGTIVYAGSGKQLNEWLKEFGVAEAPINLMPVQDIVKEVVVRGPADGELLERIKELHRRSWLS